jgi:hypothetical protein
MAVIPQRTRYFLAVEGESEQSLVKWWQGLADRQGLHIHLECHPLGGGGFKSMLNQAASARKKGLAKAPYKASFLLVDEDRTDSGNDWPIHRLRTEAATHKITVCCQRPNLEGVLFRMLPGKEHATFSNSASPLSQLTAAWPNYQKPVNARTLENKYSLADLQRIVSHEPDMHELLRTLGLLK